MLDILRHWNPTLIQSSINKSIYIANYCPVCKYYNPYGRHFRYNPKLKVIKCYNCGMSAKSIGPLLHQIKHGPGSHPLLIESPERRRAFIKRKLTLERNRFEKVSRCESYDESQLPF